MSLNIVPIDGPRIGHFNADGDIEKPEELSFDEVLRKMLGKSEIIDTEPLKQEDQWWFEPMEKLRFAYEELQHIESLASFVMSGQIGVEKTTLRGRNMGDSVTLCLASASTSLSAAAKKLKDSIPRLSFHGAAAVETPITLRTLRHTWRIQPNLIDAGMGTGLRPSDRYTADLGNTAGANMRDIERKRTITTASSEDGAHLEIDGEEVDQSLERDLFKLYQTRVFRHMTDEVMSGDISDQLYLKLADTKHIEVFRKSGLASGKFCLSAADETCIPGVLAWKALYDGDDDIFSTVESTAAHLKACRRVLSITETISDEFPELLLHWTHRCRTKGESTPPSSNLLLLWPGGLSQCVHIAGGAVTVTKADGVAIAVNTDEELYQAVLSSLPHVILRLIEATPGYQTERLTTGVVVLVDDVILVQRDETHTRVTYYKYDKKSLNEWISGFSDAKPVSSRKIEWRNGRIADHVRSVLDCKHKS